MPETAMFSGRVTITVKSHGLPGRGAYCGRVTKNGGPDSIALTSSAL
jgi:hypothetical protein